jgi:hypothetical protein
VSGRRVYDAGQQRALRHARAAEGRCTRCGAREAVPGGSRCEPCREKAKDTPRSNPTYQADWQRSNYTRVRAYARQRQARQRLDVIAGYGGRCACCGENEPVFLQLDHVNGGGTQHRRRVSQAVIYSTVIRHGFPPDYQILCANCHAAKTRTGGCPHQERR